MTPLTYSFVESTGLLRSACIAQKAVGNWGYRQGLRVWGFQGGVRALCVSLGFEGVG